MDQNMNPFAILWREVGWIHWPLALSLAAVTGLAAWAAFRVFIREDSADLRTKAWVDAILFWGGFAMISGVLGTLVGVIIAAQAIEAAGGADGALVWGGIRVSLISSAVGVLILGWAAILWFVLQLRWRLLEARALWAE